MSRRSFEPRGLLVMALLAAALATATVAVTWPLLARPRSDVLDARSLYGGAEVLVQRDINLTMWVLAWDAHALLTAPLRLFHANAFYPAPYTLALSEHMLGNVPLFAPVYWLTGNVVLAHQATLLGTFVLSGLAMWAWLRYWRVGHAAAAAGGFLFAFAPFRTWQIGNLHVIAIQWLPLVPLGIDAILDRRHRVGGPLALTLGLTLSTLCSYYTGYAAFALAGAYLAIGAITRGREGLRRAAIAAGPLAIAALVVIALSLPYLWLQAEGVLPARSGSGYISLGFMGALKAGAAGTALTFVRPIRTGIPQYLGLVTLVFATVGLFAGPPRARFAMIGAALAGYVLCLGPNLIVGSSLVPLPYQVLAAFVPGFSAMRVPQRFGAIVTIAATALAGLGLGATSAGLAARGHRWLGVMLPWIAVAGLLLEVRPHGLTTVAVDIVGQVPPAYAWLAQHGEGGPLLELPAQRTDLMRQSVYMVSSTIHWLPIANGYTPYPPRSFTTIMENAEQLPDPAALDAILAEAPFRWVLVHENRLPEGARARWRASLDVQLALVATFDGARIYEVRR